MRFSTASRCDAISSRQLTSLQTLLLTYNTVPSVCRSPVSVRSSLVVMLRASCMISVHSPARLCPYVICYTKGIVLVVISLFISDVIIPVAGEYLMVRWSVSQQPTRRYSSISRLIIFDPYLRTTHAEAWAKSDQLLDTEELTRYCT